ncbi:MAG TPA: O-antigen ligase family protein [Phycisphaerae bacterium]|nr:O-antigen ligase family protein [Phycisphaerae bacterium]HRS27948.1 O-antigen ligase family protein [Phycisphaerae bacterium]
MPLTAIAFWLVYVSGLCAAVVCPAVGVALYILVYHLHPEAQWWGESVAASGIRTSLTVAAFTALGTLLRRPRSAGGATQFPAPYVLMLALVAYALLTVTWADLTWPDTLATAEKIVKIAIFVFILIRCVRKPEHYCLALLAWIVGVAFLGYQAWGGVGVRMSGRLAIGVGGPDFAESSDLSVHMVASLPLIGAMFFTLRAWLGRGFALLAGALAVNAAILTRTRNALFGLAAITVVAVLQLPKRQRVKGCLGILAGYLLAAQLADPGWWERMKTILDYQQNASAMQRITYWKAAIDMVAQNPAGIGLGQFQLRVQDYTPEDRSRHSAHNTLMTCLAELGIPGAFLFVALVVISLWRLNKLRRWKDVPTEVVVHLGPGLPRVRFHLGWYAMALQAALVGYLACGMFTTRLWAEGFWILVGLACSLNNVAQELRAAAGRPAEGARACDGQGLSPQPLPGACSAT